MNIKCIIGGVGFGDEGLGGFVGLQARLSKAGIMWSYAL